MSQFFSFRRKRWLLPLLCLLLALPLAACGQKEEEPTQEITKEQAVQPDEIKTPTPAEPFQAYLDLSNLPPEDLASATQTLDQKTEAGGITCQLLQAIGDARTLHVAFTLTYPADQAGAIDPTSLTALLVLGEVKDPTTVQAPAGISTVLQAAQTDETTISCTATFTCQEPQLEKGTVLSLVVEAPAGSGLFHTLTWTAENQGTFREAPLLDKSGKQVGDVVLSPFAMNLTFQEPSDLTPLLTAITLKDKEGKAIEAWQSARADSQQHILVFFSLPPAVEQVASVQAGDFSATF
ncbi:MAG: hypothetical protein SOR61_08280 [Evtepia sp.]|uniref:hypothetical protein n=1 Tax=Evtepia sp. TaxID=2773933 RepID=UPI002A74FCB3|nr:hypothetical protein [Evtepia sp.]MDY3015156.1 hypothetical protein [Evtepia sp.]